MKKIMSFYLSSENGITVSVDTDENFIIIESAPIVKKFINQPLKNLENWMKTKAIKINESPKYR